MKHRLNKFYTDYFKDVNAFFKKYKMHTKNAQNRRNPAFARPSRNITSCTPTCSTKKMLSAKGIKIAYIEAYKDNARLNSTDDIKFSSVKMKIGDIQCEMAVDLEYNLEIRMYVAHDSSRKVELMGITSYICKDTDGFALKTSTFNVDSVDDLDGALNHLMSSECTDELMFQYSLLYKDIDKYIEMCKVLQRVYDMYMKTGKLTAFILYNAVEV